MQDKHSSQQLQQFAGDKEMVMRKLEKWQVGQLEDNQNERCSNDLERLSSAALTTRYMSNRILLENDQFS